jgi:hypothetical protein
MAKPKGAHKETRAMIARIEAAGCEVRLARNKHWKVYRDGRYLATMAGSPSDWRSKKNCEAQLKRLGVAL